MKHVHLCPKCFEYCECSDDCEIENDHGLPRGHAVECPACDLVWDLDKAIDLCDAIEHVISHFGFHVGMRGSVMLTGISTHDLDLIVYPHNSTVLRTRELYKALCELGLERQKNVAEVHTGWRLRGSTDEKNVEIWTIGDRVVDILYAGFVPYAG